MVELVLGLALLLGGAEALVRGAGRIALAFRVPVMVVALTVVAFGTSMPELIVSLLSALEGKGEMALANVTGSNTANIALVLGCAAMVAPLDVGRDLMRREVPVTVGLQLLVPLLLLDGTLGRVDGAVLIAGGVLYNGFLIRDALSGRLSPDDLEEVDEGGSWPVNLAFLVVGAFGLFFGARLFVGGAVTIAEMFGLSQRVIGLTVIAMGTSAPEIATSVVSAARGEADMAVGNSLGSNILNIAMVLGITAMVTPIHLTEPGAFTDLGIALFVVAMLVPIVLRGKGISRMEGGLLAGGYVIYLMSLTVSAGG